MSVEAADEEKIKSELKGKTLRVYWFMLRTGGDVAVGVRSFSELQVFLAPTLAAYHLKKLEELGLVKKKHGE